MAPPCSGKRGAFDSYAAGAAVTNSADGIISSIARNFLLTSGAVCLKQKLPVPARRMGRFFGGEDMTITIHFNGLNGKEPRPPPEYFDDSGTTDGDPGKVVLPVFQATTAYDSSLGLFEGYTPD